jgi:hypothetical protein
MSRIILEEVDVPFRDLPEPMRGLKILLISDLHAGFFFRRKVRGANRLIKDLSPDLIACTGDTVNCPEGWPIAVKWLSSLPSDVPRYAVAGNWDYARGGSAALFAEQIRRAGLIPLQNEWAILKRKDVSLRIAGLDDIRLGTFDPDRAFDGEKADFTLALSHNPDTILHIDETQFDLMLSGHTHGGQVCIPGRGAVFTSTHIGKPYASGLFELREDRYLYVSRGLGECFVPWRAFCPAELTLITLRNLSGTN